MHRFLLSFVLGGMIILICSCIEERESQEKEVSKTSSKKVMIPAIDCYPDMNKYYQYPSIGVISAQFPSGSSNLEKTFLGIKDTEYNVQYESWRNSGADCQIVYIFFASRYDDNYLKNSGYKISDIMSFDNRTLSPDKVIMMKDKWVQKFLRPGEIEQETSIFIIDAEYSSASRFRSEFKKKTYNK